MEASFLNHIGSELRRVLGNDIKLLGQEPVGGGCISPAAKLKTNGGDFFIKWNDSSAADLFLREGEGLAEMSKAAGDELIIPKVFLAAKAGQWPGYIVMEYLSPGHIPMEEERLGSGLASMHRFVSSRFGFDADNYCGSTPQRNSRSRRWTDFFIRNRLRFLLDELSRRGRYHTPELNTFERLISRLPGLLPEFPPVSLIHGDLWSGNYLYTTGGPALIDPAAYYAHREMELGMMRLFGGFSARTWNAYHYAFPPEPGWEQRIEIYQLYHLLNHYVLFGGSYGRQALSLASKYAG